MNNFFGVVLSAVFFGALALATCLGRLPPQIIALYGVASAVCFALYAIDKANAKAGRWRLPEHTLHLWSLAGGWPGALAAQQLLRHKTRKTSFTVMFWLCVAVNGAALYGLCHLL